MGNDGTKMTRPLAWLAWVLLFAMQALSQTTLKIHLYSPWANDPTRNSPPAFIEMVGSGPPIPFRDNVMTSEGGDWYTVAISYTGTPDQNKHHSFTFVNYIPNANFKWSAESRFAADGNLGGGPAFNLGDVFFTKGWTEVWIIPQVGKPPIIQDFPPPKKVMFFFNPWPSAAATMRQGTAAGYSAMRLPDGAAASRCGWYVHYFRDSAYTVHFKHIRNPEVFGQAGIGSAQSIDLTNAFKTADTVYVYQEFSGSGPAKVSPLFPSDRMGTCSYKLAMTIRDFSREHPDFERGAHGGKPAPHFGDNGVIKNMVMPTLDTTDRKPDQGPRKFFQEDFDNWFRTNSSAADPKMRNYEVCRDLDVLKDKDGYWSYSSLHQNPAKGFFPITDLVNPISAERYTAGYNDGYDPTKFAFNPAEVPKQNFHFCMEMHATFKYEQGQVFSFIGDDDVWVFINNKLAIDLGGPHSPQKASVALDSLGLTAKKDYNFDLFYCERSTSGSNLYIQTSIYFEQQRSIFAEHSVLPDGSIKWIIKEKLTTGGGYCGATGSTTVIQPAPSKFVLTGPGLTAPVELPVGVSYSGVNVNAAKTDVTVDTAKVKGLRDGIYTITYTSLSTGQSNILQFTIPKPIFPQAEMPRANPPGNTRTTRDAPVVVSLSTATATAKILYTLDGSTPDTVVGGNTRQYVAGTTTLSFTTTVTLKAIAVAPDHLPSPVMTETYTRVGPPVAATPVATPPGRRFIEPLPVTLETLTPGATILYTTDGSTPDSVAGGATKVYSGPLTLSATTTLKAIAVIATMEKSGVLTETYTYAPPVTARSGWTVDADGDGRVEAVVVEFSGPIAIVPEKINLKIVAGDGTAHDRAATRAKNEIILAAGPGTRVTVNLSTPLPFGVTSVAAAGSAGQVFRQEDIPLLDGSFPISDSVGPVLTRSEVMPADSLNPLKRVVLTFSEAVTLPAGPGNAVVFKREGQELAAGSVAVGRAEPGPGNTLVLYVDSVSQVFPIVGDSVALLPAGGIVDAAGNAPERKLFRALEGVIPKASPPKVYVTFADGSRTAGPGSRPGAVTNLDARVLFVPISSAGRSLSGSLDVGTEGNFAGPVIHMEVPGPSTYDFRIFNNLGEFVADGKGAITEADLRQLTPMAGGTKYMARVVWTGRGRDGRKAGTGAYVLVAQVKTEKDMKSGALPAAENRKIRFGMLRTQTGS